MPLPSQTSFQWRPNDNSAVTNLRYDIEASKWVDSVNRAQSKIINPTYAADLGFLGAIVTMILCLLFFIFMIPIALIREIFGYNGDEPTGRINRDHMEVLHEEIAALKRKYPNPNIKKNRIWDELTLEEQQLVQLVRANTAKAQ